MTEKTEELIAEARTIAKHSAVSLPDHADCLTRLADALEAATGQDECALPGHAGCTRVVVDGEPWFDHLPAERDAALAAIERVREAHRKFTYYELEDSCPDTSEDHRDERHHESDEIGEFYCEDMPTGVVVCDLCRDADGERMDWPCPTIAALDGAPEPEVEELPETGLEMRDSDGDLIMSGEHRKVLHQGMYVCDSCVNDLGLNVRWDRAGFMEGHPFPVEGESKA